MHVEQFAEVMGAQFQLCEDVLVDKRREYATAEVLHNFYQAAKMQNITPLEALAGMMAKHTVSLYDMCRSEYNFDMSKWNEKITDHINYLILLKAIVIEEIDFQAFKDSEEDIVTEIEHYKRDHDT